MTRRECVTQAQWCIGVARTIHHSGRTTRGIWWLRKARLWLRIAGERRAAGLS